MNRKLTFAYPGRLDLNTGGYAYDRRVIEGLRQSGYAVDLMSLGEGFPSPSLEGLREASEQLSGLADGSLVIIDGLAFGVLDAWAIDNAERLRIVALVHHPLALETGISTESQRDLQASECRALSAARHVIVTSPMTARELTANYAVDARSITVALPGTDRAARDPGDAGKALNDPPHVLSVGTLSRRKGHDVLINALKAIEDLPWRATIIGSRSLDPEISQALEAQIGELDLDTRVTLAGEVSNTRPAFASADIFALASRYEGYGMVFAEALSHGLPIVACKAGAVPDVVPEDAGILVPVDDVEAFAQALRLLLTDQEVRQRRAQASTRAGALLPSWNDTVAIIANSLGQIA